MQLGMIGLGRMGGNIVRRLMRNGHTSVVYDRSADAVSALAKEGATGSSGLADFVGKLTAPKVVWVMLPSGKITHDTIVELSGLLGKGDILIDGGNSKFLDDIAHAELLSPKGITFVDVGTSGGVWGLERGYCMMIGGTDEAVRHLDPILGCLAPGVGSIDKTPGREGRDSRVENGYIHAGPAGAGHFAKMVHNGMEYGIMQAYAEGLAILKGANIGSGTHVVDAETTPMREPDHYRYDMPLPDIAATGRERRQDRIDARYGARVAADHHAIAALQAPDAAARADVEIMDAALFQRLAAAHVILPERIAAIDDDVAGLH